MKLRVWGFVFCLAGLFLCGAFLFPVTSQAKAGFFKTVGPGAPKTIKEAASAVYRYVILADDRPQILQKRDYQNLIGEFSKGEFVSGLVAKKITECSEQNLETCAIDYVGSGTAFVVGPNHDRLITVRHNLDWDAKRYKNYLDSTENDSRRIWLGSDEQALMRSMPLHFMLFDQKGRKVFDTQNPGDYGVPEVVGFQDMLSQEMQLGLHGPAQVDFASIKLSHSVGTKSLTLRPTKIEVGETLTVIGFPQKTNTREILDQAPDSDGINQYYSDGQVLPIPEVLQFMYGPSYFSDLKRDESISRSILYTDSESVMGFSGSPILDLEGRVAGILEGQWAVTEQKFYTVRSAIVVHSQWINKNIQRYSP